MSSLPKNKTKQIIRYNPIKGNEIEGELDIFISQLELENDGDTNTGNEILIHGNPEGLKSFANLLLALAELNQEKVDNKYLPTGAKEHYHLKPGIELSKSSVDVIVGRLDAKGTGKFYDRYVSKND
ncbi:MAG: hypothetical protein K2Q22_14200 [Cytophagales bacterium]|nr:hypothetical protein [Cytophagales bacterium]